MSKEILTSGHPKWGRFKRALFDKLYGFGTLDGTPGQGCSHDFRYTREILESLGDIDVDGTIKAFEGMGGGCDCKLIMLREEE